VYSEVKTPAYNYIKCDLCECSYVQMPEWRGDPNNGTIFLYFIVIYVVFALWLCGQNGCTVKCDCMLVFHSKL